MRAAFTMAVRSMAAAAGCSLSDFPLAVDTPDAIACRVLPWGTAFECVGGQLRVGMYQGAPLPGSLLDLFRAPLEDVHRPPAGIQQRAPFLVVLICLRIARCL